MWASRPVLHLSILLKTIWAGSLIMTAMILGVAYGTDVANASPDSTAHAVKYRVHIIRSPLSTVLKELATQTGIQIAGLSEATNGGSLAGPISGTLTLDSALNLALADTALTYHWVNDHTVAISLAKSIPGAAHREPEPAEQEKHSQQPDSLGAVSEPPASPVLDSGTSNVASPRPSWFARILGAILTCGSIAHGGLACAQTAPEPDQNLTEIVVTGQRAALIRAEEIKRLAVGVVDSVSAEDAGKFPDENVADSLQRVPGVSIDRSGGAFSINGGESSSVTIRGFGPQFVNTLLNGRVLPSFNNADRSFNFEVLPSEVISAVVVHKTSSAEIAEGGIGGTIDVHTARPLDQKAGFSISGTAAGADTIVSGGPSSPVTPKLSTQFGWTNDGGTFGWLLSGMYSKRDDHRQLLDTEGWYTNQNANPLNPNVPANFAYPTTLDADTFTERRTHQDFGAAIDWIPIESVKVKFDSLLANYKVDTYYNRFDLYGNSGDTLTLTADANGTPLAYTRIGNGLENDYVVASIPVNGFLVQNGLNVAWDINKSTQLDLDVAPSQAWNKTDAQSYFAVIGVRNTGLTPTFTNNTSGGNNLFPSYNPATILPTTNTGNLFAHFAELGGYYPNVDDQIFDSRLHLTEAFNDQARLDVGVQVTHHVLTTEKVSGTQNDCNWYCGYSVPLPASVVGAYVFNAGSSFVNGNAPGVPTQFVGFNVPKFFAYLASPAAINQLTPANQASLRAYLASNGGTFGPTPQTGSYFRLGEQTKTAYVKGDFNGSLWDRAWALDAGMRYVYTDTKANSYYQPLTAITINPLDPTNAIETLGPLSDQDAHGNYGYLLPSANIKLSLRDDLVFRLGLSKTVTRPELGQLNPTTSYTGNRPSNLFFTTGNPNLKPYTSKNVDMGLEWYINNSSYIAAEGFYKDVDNFATQVNFPVKLLGYAFQEQNWVNLNKAIVKGAEFTANYQFTQLPSPFDGLGTALNYTWVTSTASINPAVLASGTTKFGIPGIGDSGNASGYYEKGPWQLRLAYNWRGAYLQAVAGADGSPTTVKTYGQLDLSTSYKVNDHLSVFASATNLTDEIQVWYQVYLNRLQSEEKDGRTLTVGVHGKW
jgi:iron complex outermembrane receptor protein